MKRPLVRGLVAEIERQVLVMVARADFVEADALEIEGALGEPPVLGHALDEQVFGRSCGTMLVLPAVEEFFEFVLVFVRQEDEAAGEPMAERVEGDGPLTFGRLSMCLTLTKELMSYLRW